mgnify:CR=1 FL=1
MYTRIQSDDGQDEIEQYDRDRLQGSREQTKQKVWNDITNLVHENLVVKEDPNYELAYQKAVLEGRKRKLYQKLGQGTLHRFLNKMIAAKFDDDEDTYRRLLNDLDKRFNR